MSDCEQLVLAAKASGLDYTAHNFAAPGELEDGWGMVAGIGKFWNPLTDDGDALRLAVKLRIPQDIKNDTVFTGWQSVKPVGGRSYIEPIAEKMIGDLDMAAVRRAIVRAAAEIGRRMP